MISRLAPIVLVLSLAGCRRAPDLEAERGAVRALFDQMATSLCAGDWPAYQDTWAHDSTVERLDAARGSWLTGWAPISALYQSITPQLRGCRFELTTMRIHVSQDATMAWAVSEGRVHMADTTIAPTTLWGAFGFEKRAGRWRMVLDHSAVPVVADTIRRQ
jgi:ketosteroid isomerase-like protein